MNAHVSFDDAQRRALEQIALIAGTALGGTGRTASLRSLFGPAATAAPGTDPARPPLALRAKALYAARRRRDRSFAGYADLLADPAWDLLLDLFIAHAEDRAVSISSACLAACVAPTTALRWLVTLERRNLVERTPDRDDRRRNYVSLSAEGLALVEQTLAQL